ncbi:GGDEF domain-containing protein [Sinimarinibacterium sp. CAU 1509]|uniref:GGDEF domain-containing protein n=1 Tax=Sinimarinibacterium sp. CAU 1509 TaxID=2562283 RepID=UPI00146BAC36|nr:GGDEF domain-containing protein [Sinimarinibacterium sp. CAU 1509]
MKTKGKNFAVEVLDALSAHIAVLDASGCIIAVNEAWRAFARSNDGVSADFFIGTDYVQACCSASHREEDDTAKRTAAGIRALLEGADDEFLLEYPCHSPAEKRWFIVRASAFTWNEHRFVVVAHENITARKQAEIGLHAAKQELEQTNRLLSHALERETLLARTDALTELQNRRYFMELARLEFAAAERYQQTLSIALLDIDRFKRVNDLYGHQQGDQVLKRMAAILRREIRQSDLSARFGGEEFIVLLRNTDARDAMHQLDRLRTQIEAAEIPAAKQAIRITVSIGVAERQASDSLDTLIGRADAALYRAKANGRNCTILADALSPVFATTEPTEPEF